MWPSASAEASVPARNLGLGGPARQNPKRRCLSRARKNAPAKKPHFPTPQANGWPAGLASRAASPPVAKDDSFAVKNGSRCQGRQLCLGKWIRSEGRLRPIRKAAAPTALGHDFVEQIATGRVGSGICEVQTLSAHLVVGVPRILGLVGLCGVQTKTHDFGHRIGFRKRWHICQSNTGKDHSGARHGNKSQDKLATVFHGVLSFLLVNRR